MQFISPTRLLSIFTQFLRRFLLFVLLIDIKSKTLHTTPILLDHVLAFSLWITTVGKEHAFVASCLFVLAYTTGLDMVYISINLSDYEGRPIVAHLDRSGGSTRRLEI